MDSAGLEVRLFAAARDHASWRRALAVRHAVFVREQNVPESEEVDAHDVDDPTCVHALAELAGDAVATGRIYESGPAEGRIGRMAVLPEHRGHGTGMAILDALIKEARRRGLRCVVLDAQVQAIEFYARRGFAPEGSDFLDCGIPHRAMRLTLPNPGAP